MTTMTSDAEKRFSAAPVLEEIGVQIAVLDSPSAVQYARDYMAFALNLRSQPPRKPAKMHYSIAKAVRDIAADGATEIRLYGPHRGASPGGAA